MTLHPVPSIDLALNLSQSIRDAATDIDRDKKGATTVSAALKSNIKDSGMLALAHAVVDATGCNDDWARASSASQRDIASAVRKSSFVMRNNVMAATFGQQWWLAVSLVMYASKLNRKSFDRLLRSELPSSDSERIEAELAIGTVARGKHEMSGRKPETYAVYSNVVNIALNVAIAGIGMVSRDECNNLRSLFERAMSYLLIVPTASVTEQMALLSAAPAFMPNMDDGAPHLTAAALTHFNDRQIIWENPHTGIEYLCDVLSYARWYVCVLETGDTVTVAPHDVVKPRQKR